MREILIKRSAIVGAVGFLSYLGARFGLPLDEATRDVLVDGLELALPVVLPMAAAFWARLGVTPVYDPKDAQGRDLVPVVTDEDPHADEAWATAPVDETSAELFGQGYDIESHRAA
jgi:hypothetical protein